MKTAKTYMRNQRTYKFPNSFNKHKGLYMSLCFMFFFNANFFSQGNNSNPPPHSNAPHANREWQTQGNTADTNAFIGTTNTTDLRLKTNNVERMRISKAGNIGIGVVNPLEKFELQGNIKLRGDMIFSNYANTNDSLGRFLTVDKNGKTSTTTMDQLKSTMYAERFTVCDLAGNPIQQNPSWSAVPYKLYSRCSDVFVGIGTSDPKKLLD